MLVSFTSSFVFVFLLLLRDYVLFELMSPSWLLTKRRVDLNLASVSVRRRSLSHTHNTAPCVGVCGPTCMGWFQVLCFIFYNLHVVYHLSNKFTQCCARLDFYF